MFSFGSKSPYRAARYTTLRMEMAHTLQPAVSPTKQ